MEQWTDSAQVYQGRIFSVRAGTARLEDGMLAHREVVEHPGGVAIVPYAEGRVVLIRQYRIAVGREILEIPAGKLEGDEALEERARAELEEETGYRAGTLVPAGNIYASVGYTSERIHLYLALDLVKTRQRLESDERIQTAEMTLDEVKDAFAAGRIEDAKTIIGLERLLAHLAR